MTSRGPISNFGDPAHTAELVERHEVSVPIPPQYNTLSAPACATERGQQEFARAAVWSACREQALEWLSERGLEAEIHPFEKVSNIEGDEPRWGVTFTIVVGRGATRPPERTDSPRVAPELHNWNWSARWQYWSTYFAGMTGPAAVTRLSHAHALAEGFADGSVIDIEDVRERHARRHGGSAGLTGTPLIGTPIGDMPATLGPGTTFDNGGFFD
jgi:hypothetical protein